MSVSARRPVVAIASSADRASSGRVVDDPQRAARLDDHHAHVVGDHVVELAGDPLALLAHRPARALLALPVLEASLLLEVVRVQASDPCRVAEEPRDEQDQLRLDEARESAGTTPGR